MKNRVYRITICAMCAALYFVLACFVSIKAGNLRITFASLPTLVCAALYGPGYAAVSAGLGEFLNQMLSYGLMPTTALWLIPPVVRGVIMGLWCRRLGRGGVGRDHVVHSTRAYEKRRARGGMPEDHSTGFLVYMVVTAVFITLLNTATMYLDALIVGYSAAYVFADFFPRLLSGIVTAVILGLVAPPVLRALRGALRGR